MGIFNQLQQIRNKEKNERDAATLQAANPDAIILSKSSGGDDSGAQNLAKVHRAQWKDYLARFAPVEDMLFDRFYDTANKQEAVDKAGLSMASAMDRSKQQSDMDLKDLGINVDPGMQHRRDKTFAIEKSKNVAGAQNAMRIAKEDQRMGIMTGGLSSVAQQRGTG